MTSSVSQTSEGPEPIPAAAGIGLRGPYHARFLKDQPPVPWLEGHSENFFAEDGIALGALERIRRDYPISLHGVGLSIGSTDPLDEAHLSRLRWLCDRIQPGLISEHLCWGAIGGHHTNDLLPLPYTEEALDHMIDRVARVQETLGRRLLVENVSSYLEFESSSIPEWEFLTAVARRSGCALLLDVNNVYVNSVNHGFDVETYIDSIPPELVAEMHLAGHTVQEYDGRRILVDTHNAPVCDAVWALFERAVRRFGARPTLIEWDSDFPPLETLLGEAGRAQRIIDEIHDLAA